MEEQDLSLVDIRTILWGYRRYRKGLCSLLSSDRSPLTSLFDNHAFPQGMGVYYFRFTFPHCMASGALLHTPPLWNSRPSCRSQGLAYCSSLIFLWATVHFHPNAQYTDWIWTAVLPPWDAQRHTLLHALLHDELPTYTIVWFVELEKELSAVVWLISFHFTHKLQSPAILRKKNFKLLSQWYRDPSTLHKIFSYTSDTWRCGFA